MSDLKSKIEKILEQIDWASNTHKDRLMFGLDELGASIVREHRLHGTLMESRRFIIAQEQKLQEQNKILKESLEKISINTVEYVEPTWEAQIAREALKKAEEV